MPRRRITRAHDRTRRINTERELNQTHTEAEEVNGEAAEAVTAQEAEVEVAQEVSDSDPPPF